MNMPIKYKLTNQEMQTHGGFQWELGKPAPELDGEGDLCSEHFYHFYDSPLLAVLLNPIHANIKNPRLFKAQVSGKCKKDGGLKCSYTQATLVEEMVLPIITVNQKAAFAILCSKAVYKDKTFSKWANNWLKNKDRTADAARAVGAKARARAIALAAGAAEAAAKTTARAAVEAAVRAAEAAVEAAAWTAEIKPLNLIKIAKQAMRYK